MWLNYNDADHKLFSKPQFSAADAHNIQLFFFQDDGSEPVFDLSDITSTSAAASPPKGTQTDTCTETVTSNQRDLMFKCHSCSMKALS